MQPRQTRRTRPSSRTTISTRIIAAVVMLLLTACTEDRRRGADVNLSDGPELDTGADVLSDTANDARLTDVAGDADVGSGDATLEDALPDASIDTTADTGADVPADTIRADTGPALAPAEGDLVIVEIQGNPQNANDEQAEYFEVLNVSGRTLELNGMRITHVAYSGGEPSGAVPTVEVNASVLLLPGDRALFARSTGGFFGGATAAFVYDAFEFDNSANLNRLRLMTPSWDGSEPPNAADIIDEVITPGNTFDNPLRGRALQLNPSAGAPSAVLNDDIGNWCHTPATEAFAYRTNNWGTPGEAEACGA